MIYYIRIFLTYGIVLSTKDDKTWDTPKKTHWCINCAKSLPLHIINIEQLAIKIFFNDLFGGLPDK